MINKQELSELSESFGIPIPSIQAIIEVESAGQGFDKATGKIKIQFEPSWFKKLSFEIILYETSNGMKSVESLIFLKL